jgi:hypothetical protein
MDSLKDPFIAELVEDLLSTPCNGFMGCAWWCGRSRSSLSTPCNGFRVYPARCWREEKDPDEVVLEFDPSKHMVFYHYRTNRNKGRIIFYNIPPSMTLVEAVELVRKMLDYDEVSKVAMAKPSTDNEHLYSMYYFKPLQ